MVLNPELKKFGPGDSNEQVQRIWIILTGAVMNHNGSEKIKTITYGELAEKLERPRGYARALGFPLGVIGRFCIRHNLPPLNVIVVNQRTGRPGKKVVLRLGSTVERDQKDVMSHNWYKYHVPNFLNVILHHSPPSSC